MVAATVWYSTATTATDRNAVKNELRIKEDDNSDNDLIDDYGGNANRQIDNLLFPHKDKIPEAEDDITPEIKEAAKFFICRKYKVRQKNFEAANEYKKQFMEIIEGVIGRLKAIPEGREDTVVYTNKYRSEPLRTRQRYFDD